MYTKNLLSGGLTTWQCVVMFRDMSSTAVAKAHTELMLLQAPGALWPGALGDTPGPGTHAWMTGTRVKRTGRPFTFRVLHFPSSSDHEIFCFFQHLLVSVGLAFREQTWGCCFTGSYSARRGRGFCMGKRHGRRGRCEF